MLPDHLPLGCGRSKSERNREWMHMTVDTVINQARIAITCQIDPPCAGTWPQHQRGAAGALPVARGRRTCRGASVRRTRWRHDKLRRMPGRPQLRWPSSTNSTCHSSCGASPRSGTRVCQCCLQPAGEWTPPPLNDLLLLEWDDAKGPVYRGHPS